MQPYVFPYIGYFHLIEAASEFVVYDDVQFIKQGWINRNRILNQGEPLLFTVPLEKASRNKLILETTPNIDSKWRDTFYKRLVSAYSKAPFFKDSIDLIMGVLSEERATIVDLAIRSIQTVYAYLGREFVYHRSSLHFPETRDAGRAGRLIAISKALGAERYLNPPGGRSLYSAEEFENEGLTLRFVESDPIQYKQLASDFTPNLSIIDAMMFNSPQELAELMSRFRLEA